MTFEKPEVVLRTAEDVTDEVLSEVLEAVDGVVDYDESGREVIEWEDVYDLLERLTGYFVSEMDSPADRKIRRHVRNARKEVL